MAATGSPSTYQLHLDLGGLTLTELADVIAEQALLSLPEPERRRYLPDVRARVERVLRRHVVAYDACGMGSLCKDSQRYDPWPDAPAQQA